MMTSPLPHLLHLTASPCYGGPERGIIATIANVPNAIHHVATFAECGASRPFVAELSQRGIDVHTIHREMPHLLAATRDLIALMRQNKIDLLFANGHKSRVVGYVAAQWTRTPIVGVSRGWTWQDWKTSLYERFDQWMHRRMDAIVCVSHGQAEKVARCGVAPSRIHVIHNAIDQRRFETPDPHAREYLAQLFRNCTPRWLLGAAGRLSPEKGFDLLIEAVRQVRADGLDIGLVLFGDGVLRESLAEQVAQCGLGAAVVLPGFSDRIDATLHALDAFVQSSHTEGLPNVLLEAMSAGLPIVATSVGGTPEIIADHATGLLVPPGDARLLAAAISQLFDDRNESSATAATTLRGELALAARHRVATEFTVEAMGRRYAELIDTILTKNSKR